MRHFVSLIFALSIASVAIMGGACAEYREEIGRTSGQLPVGDGGTTPIGNDCEGFVQPTGDCSAGGGTCAFASECNPGQDCNNATGRCFDINADCRGTLCNFNEDCANGERCNQTSFSCFRLDESQVCMPCFLPDSDCGSGTCNTDLARCE